jgi:hypothetical protein
VVGVGEMPTATILVAVTVVVMSVIANGEHLQLSARFEDVRCCWLTRDQHTLE